MELRDFILMLVRKRSSCRYFDKDYRLTKEELESLIRSVDYGPSAGGIRPYKIYHEENAEKKKQLQEAALNQGFISQASSVFCIVAYPPKSKEKYGGRGTLYAIQDATIAGMCLTFVATAFDLDTCWVGSIEEDKIREIYGVGEEEIPLSLICVGKAERY